MRNLKKPFAFFLAVVMMFTVLPDFAFAEEGFPEPDVFIEEDGGIILPDGEENEFGFEQMGNMAVASGAALEIVPMATPITSQIKLVANVSQIGTGWSWVGTTLTLTNADLEGAVSNSNPELGSLISLPANATITLIGNNKVVNTDTATTYSIGIYAGDGLTINGSGSLEVIGNTTPSAGIALDGSMNISNCKVTAVGTWGIFSPANENAITLNNATLIAKGNFATNKAPILSGTYRWKINEVDNFTESTTAPYSHNGGLNTYVEIAQGTGGGSDGDTTAPIMIGSTSYSTLQAAVNAVTNGQTITITGDIEVTSFVTSNKSGVNFPINGNGTVKVSDTYSGANGSLLQVTNGNVMLEGNVTFDANSVNHGKNVRVIDISPTAPATASVTMKDNVKLTGGNSMGGGANIGANGSFIMNGGEISGNKTTSNGGGVIVSGTFTMIGGTITKNTASVGGGGVYAASATSVFIMNGGTITKNTAPSGGGGVAIFNGSNFYVYVGTGKIDITGNTKSDNTTADNVFLGNNKTIDVSGTLNSNSKIGVTTQATTYPVNITGTGATEDWKNVFTSDISKEIVLNGGVLQVTANEAPTGTYDSATGKRIAKLDLTATSVTYETSNGSKTVNPTTTSINDSIEGWKWDYSSKTLTLNGLDLAAAADTLSGKDAGTLVLPADSKINLIGENKIVNTSTNTNNFSSIGIFAVGNLTIEGTGSLEATGGKAQSSVGIAANGNLTINGCKNLFSISLTAKK